MGCMVCGATVGIWIHGQSGLIMVNNLYIACTKFQEEHTIEA